MKQAICVQCEHFYDDRVLTGTLRQMECLCSCAKFKKRYISVITGEIEEGPRVFCIYKNIDGNCPEFNKVRSSYEEYLEEKKANRPDPWYKKLWKKCTNTS